MAHLNITFDGFEELAEMIDKAGEDLHAAVDEALTETQKYVQENLEQAAAPYESGGKKGYATGEMFDAIIREPKVEWRGSVAEVRVGFDLSKRGGYHSLFVLYGVPAHRKANPGMQKDQKIYNAIFGAKTKKRIAELQTEIMSRYLTLGGNG